MSSQAARMSFMLESGRYGRSHSWSQVFCRSRGFWRLARRWPGSFAGCAVFDFGRELEVEGKFFFSFSRVKGCPDRRRSRKILLAVARASGVSIVLISFPSFSVMLADRWLRGDYPMLRHCDWCWKHGECRLRWQKRQREKLKLLGLF